MSASFHMAQRTGVILSGDYSGAFDSVTPSNADAGKYFVASNGTIFYRIPKGRYNGGKLKVYEPPKFEETILDALDFGQSGKVKVIGAADTLEAAKAIKSPTEPAEGGYAPVPKLTMFPGTWTDGSFTYVVKDSGEATVTETGVTFSSSGQPTSDRWRKFVNDLNRAYNAGTLKRGKAPAKTSSSSSSYTPPPAVAPATLAPVSTPFYKAKWFLPAVAGGTVLIVLAIALWPRKKKGDAAPVVYLPAPAPVPVPASSPASIV